MQSAKSNNMRKKYNINSIIGQYLILKKMWVNINNVLDHLLPQKQKVWTKPYTPLQEGGDILGIGNRENDSKWIVLNFVPLLSASREFYAFSTDWYFVKHTL